MIKSLSIHNYALIRELDMQPSDRLNIITGETGAGKSIMLGAVGLLLGNRADTKALWDPESKCKVEGIFDIEDYDLQRFFEKSDLDYDKECIIRREINPSGKSRAFVNDTPVTLDILKSLGEKLMDIHSQHESLHLGNNLYQQEILDTFSQHYELIKEYRSNYRKFIEASKQLEKLSQKSQESEKELDYNKFLLNELEEAKLDEFNQEEMENLLSELENAEEIKLKLTQIDQILDHEEVGTLNQLKEVSTILRNLQDLSGSYEELFDRLESVSIELKDIKNELDVFNDKTQLDPEQLEVTKARLDLLYRLQQKHLVGSVEELIKIRDDLAGSILEVDNLEEALAKAEKKKIEAESTLQTTGRALSDSRKKHAAEFAQSIESLIHELGMENGQVRLSIEPTDPSLHGMDHISILFSANKGVKPKELKEVASGGEFSRLIFAIKYLIADKTSLPTIIFDEIDTGVSGEIALKMVRMMRQMAGNHQVISISHLPQFAAGGDSHYFVFKDHSTSRSETRIKLLHQEERIEAIAKMIGGNSPSEKAFESARELMQHPAL